MSAVCHSEVSHEIRLLDAPRLERLAARTAEPDRKELFSAGDLEILRDCGYLVQAVPEELGGLGFAVSQVGCEQRRLAYYAPAAALAVHAHLSWTGLAADLWNAGDPSLEWLLREAADGEIITASHIMAGDTGDASDLNRDSEAQPVDGGYCLTGHTYLYNPVPGWSRLAVRGVDISEAAAPKIVHAFIARDADGLDVGQCSIRDTTPGKTSIDAVFVPNRYVARIARRAVAPVDRFVSSHLLWAAVGIASIGSGTARAAFDHAVTAATPAAARSRHARLRVSEMAMSLHSIEALLDSITDDWCSAVDHADRCPARILGTGCRTSDLAREIVDTAAELADRSNGSILQGWQRLMNDAVPAVAHPAEILPAREIIAGNYLGFELDDAPRPGPQSP